MLSPMRAPDATIMVGPSHSGAIRLNAEAQDLAIVGEDGVGDDQVRNIGRGERHPPELLPD